jgi:hypothetical protein
MVWLYHSSLYQRDTVVHFREGVGQTSIVAADQQQGMLAEKIQKRRRPAKSKNPRLRYKLPTQSKQRPCENESFLSTKNSKQDDTIE